MTKSLLNDHMLPCQYIQFVNLPKIPQNIIDRLPMDVEKYPKKLSLHKYNWSDEHNEEINEWCQQHICKEIYWACQFATGDLPKHIDRPTNIKFVYLLDTGGDQVYTKFWSEDGNTLLSQYLVPLHQWCIIKVNSLHSLEGMADNSVRFAVTGKIF